LSYGRKEHLADVFHAIRNMESIQADLEVAHDLRDKEISSIHKNGVPIAQIARRVGLSRPKIHKIIVEQSARN